MAEMCRLSDSLSFRFGDGARAMALHQTLIVRQVVRSLLVALPEENMREYFATFGDRLPAGIKKQVDELEKRLG